MDGFALNLSRIVPEESQRNVFIHELLKKSSCVVLITVCEVIGIGISRVNSRLY